MDLNTRAYNSEARRHAENLRVALRDAARVLLDLQQRLDEDPTSTGFAGYARTLGQYANAALMEAGALDAVNSLVFLLPDEAKEG